MDEKLSEFLRHYDSSYDPSAGIMQVAWQGPGYHTKIKNGQLAHPTRENLDYALVLLESGESARIKRAGHLIEVVLSLQDRDPCSATYGIWPWFWDEPIAEMNPPDWNWADFCGVRLAHILRRHEALLAEDLRAAISEAMRAAAYSIFRRNVGSGYTNIAVKGAIVAGLVGELLDDDFLKEYARRRLILFLARCKLHGGFSEYNSPTYGMLVLHEVERGLFLLEDPPLRDLMGRVHEVCWRLIEQTLHLGTGQLCGPQSRAYQDLLSREMAVSLELRLGVALFLPAGMKDEVIEPPWSLPEPYFLIPPIPCPEHICKKIAGTKESFERHIWVRSDDPDIRREAAIWRTPTACLGSINYDNLWMQRRPVLGYWRAGKDVATLRIRMKHSGGDFASGSIRTVQKDGSLIAVVSLATNKGDYHDHLDRPSDGCFLLSELAVVVELTAPDARVERRDDGGFRLSSGNCFASVRPLLGQFEDFSVRWEERSQDGRSEVCAVIDDGRQISLKPEGQRCLIVFALSLSPEGVEVEDPKINIYKSDENISINTIEDSFSLSVPLASHPVRDHFTP